MIPNVAGLLKVIQRAIEFEDFAGVFVAANAFQYTHVQLLFQV